MSYQGIVITGTVMENVNEIATNLSDSRAIASQVALGVFSPSKEPKESVLGNPSVSAAIDNEVVDRMQFFAQEALESGKTPLLVMEPSLALFMIENSNTKLLSFYVDVSDQLQERSSKKSGRGSKTRIRLSVCTALGSDRQQEANKFDYFLINKDLDTTTSLIKRLWEMRGIGGGLSQNLIKLMIECGMLLENADISGVKGASYDLLLGDEYYYAGKINRLSDSSPFLTIEPYDYAIVSCKERARMPRDVIAKFGLTVGLFCQGIILSNGPQIDPGFNGTLFCLLFNTSNLPVHLKRQKHYATIEFNKLIEPANPYEGQYQGTEKIIEYIPSNALRGAINELKKEIEKLKNESKVMQNIYLGVVGLMFAIISILLVLK